MNLKNSAILLLVGVILGLTSCQQETDIRIIPVEDFFKEAPATQFTISPDGTNLAYLKKTDNKYNLFVRPVNKIDGKQLTFSQKLDLKDYRWFNDNLILYKTIEKDTSKLIAVDISNSKADVLMSGKGISIKILNTLPQLADKILIAVNLRNRKIFDVYRLNIMTGEKELVHSNPGNFVEWVADSKGNVKIGVASDGTRMVVHARQNETEQFEPFLSTSFDEVFQVKAFTPDDNNLYVISNINRDKSVLIEYDFVNNRNVKTIYEHPFVDLENIILSNQTGEAIGVVYTDWKFETHFFDPEDQEFQEKLNRLTDSPVSYVISRDSKDEKFIVRTYSDKSPGSYFYYDDTNDDLFKLADLAPWLLENEMSHMKSIAYKSRDGLTIKGYLTLPRNVPANHLPTVVMLHGGLWKRDSWGFNKEAQMIANRGYAVFMINYRGSAGYGQEFRRSGYKQWGLKIQDDITDGVEWLIKQDIADADRIAIMGNSYGGYAALMGLALTPDLYAAGISCCSITDHITFLNSVPPKWEPFRQILSEIIGDPLKDKLMLKQYSPVSNVDKMNAPLFFAHGIKDTKADIYQVKKMASILHDRGIDVETMFKENEGHGFKSDENKIEFYKRSLEFLRKHLNDGLISK